MGRIVDGRFEVTNGILNMALFGGWLNKNYINGYINNDKFSRSRAVLTHLTQEILSIHRFPGFEEYYRSTYGAKIRVVYKELDSKDIQDAKDELEDLYKHTQDYLKGKYPSKSSLILKRSLNGGEQKQVANQLLDQKDIVEFESNIILSFADYNFLGSYNSKVLLEMDVPFEQILIHYDSIVFPNGTSGEEKENEVWVLNKDPFGRIKQPKDNFRFEKLSRNKNDFPDFSLPQTEDFWGYEEAYKKHRKVWDDPWVQFIIKLRKKMGKLN
ncbi:hypothetical protein [Peribacillus sp. NPDC097295]|uniref:hypothetical protein n=1 Tax=Peribacillus sp. NPDC097295 TaxID=3364402 RepID=UPI00381A7734